MADNTDDLIVLKKKKVVAGGHHGGAWKVAYADFVTAMMSLFIVLWLLSSSNEQTKKAIAGYFNDPKGTAKLAGSSMAGTGHAVDVSQADMPKLKEKLLASARQLPNFEKLKKQVEISASPDGLRIELMEKDGGTFFDSGDAHPTPELEQFLALIGGELGKMPNKVSIEGHTDARPYSSPEGYSNWELSADRANAARRLLQAHGLGAGQVQQVRGFADQMPRKPDDPMDASNRRITIIVDPTPVVEQPAPAGGGTEDAAEEKPGAAKEVAEVKPGAAKATAEAKPGAAKEE